MSSHTVPSRFFSPSPTKAKRRHTDDALDSPAERNPKRCKIANPSPHSGFVKSGPAQQPSIDAKKSRRMRELLGSTGDCVPNKRNKLNPVARQENTSLRSFPLFTNISRESAATSLKCTRRETNGVGPGGKKWSDLEKQVLAFKKDNPGVLLMFEVGYRYFFYDSDATVAAQTLGIVAFTERNFLAACIPVFKREIHLKKLLSQGHTVGIIEQTETAAVKKAGNNRNTIFDRKLVRLYTANTYSNAMDSADDVTGEFSSPLMFIAEHGAEKKVSFSIIALSLSTGDVVWDNFEDTPLRVELETRISHLHPCEVIISNTLSSSTEQMLKAFNWTCGNDKDVFQIKHLSSSYTYTEAFERVTLFYTQSTSPAQLAHPQVVAEITAYPKLVIILLAQAITYLVPFGVSEALLASKFYVRFTAKAHMLLSASTLANLEIYQNTTDGSTTGSLFSILDQTCTQFGSRLLRAWVGKPLVDKRLLKERVDAVEEILTSQSPKLKQLLQLLRKLPDLAKGLIRVQFGKCSPKEFAQLIGQCKQLATAFNGEEKGFRSTLLNKIFTALPMLKQPIEQIVKDISLTKAADGLKAQLWIDPKKYPDITIWQELVNVTEAELEEELRRVQEITRHKGLKWTTVANEEYLIELDKAWSIPEDVTETWDLVQSTKSKARYRTQTIKEKLSERARLKELLRTSANEAYKQFLQEVSQKHYATLREGVNNIAVADCLFSLANVARREGYTRPQFADDNGILEIEQGRHPMTEVIRPDPFIPNTIQMDSRQRCLCLTGPNMGGKSSAVRMIALAVIMAQIGSYVPASSARLSFTDGIYTRMGASDNLARGRSTFMSEMTETSDILAGATTHSLVILDELGRGTSTFDGMSIASAVLEHFLEKTRCRTLFITHYPSVVSDLEKRYPQELQNYHMDYMETSLLDGTRNIIFLYKIVPGLSPKSFGVECARLAGIQNDILVTAAQKSHNMQCEVESRRRKMRAFKLSQTIFQTVKSSDAAKLRQLAAMCKALSL